MRIAYFYALASPWCHLGQREMLALARRHGATVEPCIIDYDRMFHAAGTVPLPQRPQRRKDCRQVELKRWSAFRGVPLNPRPRFYNGEVAEPDEAEAARMAVAAQQAGLDSPELSHAIMRTVRAEERFPFRRAELLAIAAAATPALHTAHEGNTDHAIARGVLGMPAYSVEDGDIFWGHDFWGQDRLELPEWRLANGMASAAGVTPRAVASPPAAAPGATGPGRRCRARRRPCAGG
jgi:2-hydroxychromene-2-carboxylate isomerase